MTLKKYILALWILFLLSCLGLGCLNPQFFEPRFIADFLNQFKETILFIYFLLSVSRGFTLFPSTPLVLAGTILFPDEPFSVLIISIIGILFSSTMIYFFSDYLGFGDYFERKHSQKINTLKIGMQEKYGAWLVFFWSFMPFLPTDAICYVAGAIRMNFKRFVLAIGCGELIICSVYIFFYNSLKNAFAQFL